MRFLILAATLAALPASAQLSLSADTYRPIPFGVEGDATIFSTDAVINATDEDRVDALIALTGRGQTWDFTALTYSDQRLPITTETFEDPAGLPGASNFPTATRAYALGGTGLTNPGSTSYTYVRIEDGVFATLGEFVPASAGAPDFLLRNVDGLEQASFPFTFGTTVVGESEVVSLMAVPGVVSTVREVSEVVGSGTLVAPTGRFDCLMVQRTTDNTTTQDGRVILESRFIQYEWLTDSDVAATAANDEITPGQRFRVAALYLPGTTTALEDEPQSVALSVAPNPTASTSTVRLSVLEAGPVRAAVYDALGREVAVLHNGVLGAGDHGFSTSRLTPGLYVVRVEAGARAEVVRFVVAR
ncbi:T9SS type A sorting domain-containing protein [Rubrivirga sp.]|uniref:T9SS type A sorting domain-containing protein n=1 Tax=Rubrivirga sp. TaxID=1885344 RepID=UPI003C78D399